MYFHIPILIMSLRRRSMWKQINELPPRSTRAVWFLLVYPSDRSPLPEGRSTTPGDGDGLAVLSRVQVIGKRKPLLARPRFWCFGYHYTPHQIHGLTATRIRTQHEH